MYDIHGSQVGCKLYMGRQLGYRLCIGAKKLKDMREGQVGWKLCIGILGRIKEIY